MTTRIKDFLIGAGSIFFVSGNYFSFTPVPNDISVYFKNVGTFIQNAADQYGQQIQEKSTTPDCTK